jgi:drug/metabolite transporter (DMT)-like permease
VLAILLALGSACGYGASDFAAGLAARRASIIQVTLVSQIVSVIVIGAGLAATGGGQPTVRAVAWGMAAGLAGVGGALALYLGFRSAAFSIAGPLSSVGAAGFSVLAGLALGERPTYLALAGIILALPAIVGVSASGRSGAAPSPEKPARKRLPEGVGAGLAAGAGFAMLFIGLDQAGSGSGLWPVFCGQCTGLAAVAIVAGITGNLHLPRGSGATLAAVTGLTGAPATIGYFLATHHGLLAVTAVITSLYPAVTILLARMAAGEKLSAARLAGLCLAAAAIALIAVGGAG